jgi:DNA-binding transcriptional LysR family regulator
MDLEARLRAFAAVARRGSFSAAAAELGITQPGVSRHVADLEAALGTRLVAREPRGARLTPAGELLARHTGQAEALLARAEAGIQALVSGESGRLAVAVSGTPGVYLVPLALGPFTASRPDVELELRLGTSADAVELVRSHVCEVGVIGGAAGVREVQVEPLIEDEIVIVGPAWFQSRIATPRNLEAQRWLRRSGGSATQRLVDRALDDLGIRPLRTLDLPDWEMIKRAVAAGAGVTAVSRIAVRDELKAGALRVIELRGWRLVRPLSVARARDVPLSPLAEHFAATLRGLIEPV